MSKIDAEEASTHRTGTVTLGCTLIAAGIVFTAHLFIPSLTYTMIFAWWPLIFIMLGTEILVSNHQKNVRFVYDAGAIVILILMTVFAMTMAGAEMIMRYCENISM